MICGKVLRGCAALPWLLCAGSAVAAEPGEATGPWSVSGDFRLRLEDDYDSQTAAGVEREDRGRARIRARLGVQYRDDTFEFGVRARSGSNGSQQSPHFTIADFDDNARGDADIGLDRWYLGARGGNGWGWAGRNTFPFWKQNELFWDDDVTAAGGAAGYRGAHWSATVAHLALPVGMKDFAGTLSAGQLTGNARIGAVDGVLAAGFYRFNAEPGDPDAARLLSGNGARNYAIWNLSAQAKFTLGQTPIALGADLFKNAENYPIAERARDEDTGYVFSAVAGGTQRPGDWLLGYYYAHIEQLAVNNSFAQDDWVRWGNATQTRASDFKGHEIRIGRGLLPNVNLLARLYLVEALTSREDGKRFRLDLNFAF